MDYDLLIFAIGMLATGAIFFGYPIGFRRGAKTVADEQCERLEAQTPTIVRNASRRLASSSPPYKGGVDAARGGRGGSPQPIDILNAEVIE